MLNVNIHNFLLGWMILLKEVNERAKMLPSICDGSETPGQKFMFRLLIESLLSPWELHNSLISAINNELHFGKTDEKSKKRTILLLLKA